MKNITLLSAALCMLAGLGAVAPAQADEFEISLANKFGEIRYARDGEFIGLPDGGVSVAFLTTSANESVIHGTVYTDVLEGETPLSINVGARLYMARLVEPGDDVVGLGFGASARYKLPVLPRWPIYLAASIFFAPEVTTSGSSTDILDVHIIRGEMELTPSIDGLIGLRSLRIDRNVGDEDVVDERLYLGVRFRF
ncbi:MAG: hypothetical protein ACNA7W_10815 [Pseudomonadales bacterium]